MTRPNPRSRHLRIALVAALAIAASLPSGAAASTARAPIPGGGAILAAVQSAAGVSAVIAGKPYEPMAELESASTMALRVSRA